VRQGRVFDGGGQRQGPCPFVIKAVLTEARKEVGVIDADA